MVLQDIEIGVPKVPLCAHSAGWFLACGFLFATERRENLRNVSGIECDLALPRERAEIVCYHALVALRCR